VRRIKCWLRGWHMFCVADLAFLMPPGYSFTGICSDCGARRTRDGWYWRKVRKQNQEVRR
jgi:hypothetical protein